MGYKLLDTDQASEHLRGSVPSETLKQWRSRGKGPRYIRLPNGKVRYRDDWLDEFVAKHVVEPNAYRTGGA